MGRTDDAAKRNGTGKTSELTFTKMESLSSGLIGWAMQRTVHGLATKTYEKAVRRSQTVDFACLPSPSPLDTHLVLSKGLGERDGKTGLARNTGCNKIEMPPPSGLWASFAEFCHAVGSACLVGHMVEDAAGLPPRSQLVDSPLRCEPSDKGLLLLEYKEHTGWPTVARPLFIPLQLLRTSTDGSNVSLGPFMAFYFTFQDGRPPTVRI
jgi:hypothetical protein